MAPVLVEKKQCCSHLDREVVDFLELIELMRLVPRCFALVGIAQRWTEVN